MIDINQIKIQAEKELLEEQRRELVDNYKEKLKKKRWYHKLLPFKIIIIRRD